MSITLTVAQDHADIVGTDNVALQQAVDMVGAAGGGTVLVGPGRWLLHDSLQLRSGVTVRGQGEATVLVKADMVSSPLAAYLGYGHADVYLAEPDKFTVGQGVLVQDDGAPGFYATVSTLTWRDGPQFGLRDWLNHDYLPDRGGVVKSLYPLVAGRGVTGATVENLALDGNREHNDLLNGCRGGGVFLLATRGVTLRRLAVREFHGDAISFQQTRDTLVEDCLCERNSGHGLHPGSGSVGPIMRRVTCRDNGHDGIFYCLRVSWSLTEDCLLEGNGHDGISIGGRDTDHLIRRNTILHNGLHGLVFRAMDRVMAGHRCRFEDNVVAGNNALDGLAEISLGGALSRPLRRRRPHAA